MKWKSYDTATINHGRKISLRDQFHKTECLNINDDVDVKDETLLQRRGGAHGGIIKSFTYILNSVHLQASFCCFRALSFHITDFLLSLCQFHVHVVNEIVVFRSSAQNIPRISMPKKVFFPYMCVHNIQSDGSCQ